MTTSTPRHLGLAILTLVLSLASVRAAAGDPAAGKAPALQVFVDVAPSCRPLLEDDIARALGYRLEDTFRRQGYAGGVDLVLRAPDLTAGAAILELRLVEWRVDRAGQVHCTFSAKVSENGQETSLGLFTGSGITWARARDRWRLATAFEDSADDALKDLYRRIAGQKLLPGFEQKKKK